MTAVEEVTVVAAAVTIRLAAALGSTEPVGSPTPARNNNKAYREPIRGCFDSRPAPPACVRQRSRADQLSRAAAMHRDAILRVDLACVRRGSSEREPIVWKFESPRGDETESPPKLWKISRVMSALNISTYR